MLLLYISLPTLSSSVWLSCIPSLLSFSCFVYLFSPALCSSVRWCGWCRCVEWRSLGLVRRTSPSPRAVRGVALSTRPPIPLITMTLLLPLPAGQALPKAQHCTHAHKIHTQNTHSACAPCRYLLHYDIHPCAHFSSFHSLHQQFTVENLHCRLTLPIIHLHDVTLFILLPRCDLCFHFYLWLSCRHNLFFFSLAVHVGVSFICSAWHHQWWGPDVRDNSESWVWLIWMNTRRFETWLIIGAKQ